MKRRKHSGWFGAGRNLKDSLTGGRGKMGHGERVNHVRVMPYRKRVWCTPDVLQAREKEWGGVREAPEEKTWGAAAKENGLTGERTGLSTPFR